MIIGLSAHHILLYPTLLFLFAGFAVTSFKSFLVLISQAAKGSFNDAQPLVASMQPYLKPFSALLLEIFGRPEKLKAGLVPVILVALMFVLLAVKVSIDSLRDDMRKEAERRRRVEKS